MAVSCTVSLQHYFPSFFNYFLLLAGYVKESGELWQIDVNHWRENPKSWKSDSEREISAR